MRVTPAIAASLNTLELTIAFVTPFFQLGIIRNGVKIQCAVTQVIPTMEGLGSYHSAKDQLKDGSTLLIELGYGTAEIWFIDETGRIVDGAPVTRLGVINLVKAIADDPTVRALTQDNSGTVNLSVISQALQQDTLGRICQVQM